MSPIPLAYYPAAVLNRDLLNHTSISFGNHDIVALEDGDILLFTSRFTWLFGVQ